MLIKIFGILSAASLLATALPEKVSSVSLTGNHFPEKSTSTKQSADIEQRCTAAVRTAVNRLNEVSNVDVVDVTTINLSESYSNYPPSAPLGIIFSLEGTGVDNVMNSGQLMTTISNQVVTGCPVISLVKIGQNRSDYYATFGLTGNSVTAFQQCREVGILSSADSELLRWGEVYCF